MKRHFAALFVALSIAASSTLALAAEPEKPAESQETANPSPPAEKIPDRAQLEKQFAKTMSGATLVGHFTSGPRGSGEPKEDRYTIQRVTKLDGDYWLRNAQVESILKDDGWVIVRAEDAQPDDVAIYRDSAGMIVHSARVVGKDLKAHVLVDSKNGYDIDLKAVWAARIIP